MNTEVDIMNSEEFIVLRATKKDENELAELMLEIAQWLQSLGSTQWAGILEGKDIHQTDKAISRGEVFIFRSKENNEIAGSVIMQNNASEWDISLWGESAIKNDDQAVFLHRLVVARSYAGKGVGRKIMEWAEKFIHSSDKAVIKLDCISSNAKLNQFYTSCGYQLVGETNGFCKYQKKIKE